MTKKQKSKLALAFLILLVSLGLAGVMIKLGKTKARTVAVDTRPGVNIEVIRPSTQTSVYEATGAVSASKEVTIFPEVNGRIVSISKNLLPGGNVKKGDILARIDDRDYKLMVEQTKSAVKAAEIELQRETARGETAKREWALSGEKGEASPLASRKLQLENARLNLQSAKSALAQAKLKLERTVLKAPFSASVTSENAEVGQVVGAQSMICRLVGNKTLRLEVAVPVGILSSISLPIGKKSGSSVLVKQEINAGHFIEREGAVISVVGEMDTRTRRARLIIEVPMQGKNPQDLPLLPGAFVSAEIQGLPRDNIYAIPRKVIYEGNKIWTVNSDSALQSVELEVQWTRKSTVYARVSMDSLQLVTTHLAAPVDNLKIQPVK